MHTVCVHLLIHFCNCYLNGLLHLLFHSDIFSILAEPNVITAKMIKNGSELFTEECINGSSTANNKIQHKPLLFKVLQTVFLVTSYSLQLNLCQIT